MIRRYPTGDGDRDTMLAPKLDGIPKFGQYGTVVYTYRLALESQQQSNLKPRNQGRMYHPVDTVEEAEQWLTFYRSKTVIRGFERRPLYEAVWFIPRGE
jgi:hypothetical protein